MIKVEDHIGLAVKAVELTRKKWKDNYTFDEALSTAYLNLMKACEDFNEELGFKFSTYAVPKMIYGIMRWIRDDKAHFRRRGERLRILSLNTKVPGINGKAVEFHETMSDELDFEVDITNELFLNEALKELTDDERMIIDLYYFKDLKQQDIAEKVGSTQANVSRIINKSLTKMRRIAI